MRFENLVTAQFPSAGSKFIKTSGVVEVDAGRDASTVATIGRFQAGVREAVPVPQQRTCAAQVGAEVVAILTPRHRVPGQHRNRRAQSGERLTGAVLALQDDRTRLAVDVLKIQRGLDRRMKHAFAVPHAQPRIVGVDSNSAQAGDPGQPGDEKLEFGFEVVRAHHRRRVVPHEVDEVAHHRVAIAAVNRAAHQRLGQVIVVRIRKCQALNAFRRGPVSPGLCPPDHEIAAAGQVKTASLHICGEVQHGAALHHCGEVGFEAARVRRGRMHHHAALPATGRGELDVLGHQFGEFTGFDREQLAGRDREVGVVESQWTGVALPGDFGAVDDDGPLMEIAGPRMR